MRPSHQSPNHIANTNSARTSKHTPRYNRKTPWNHKNDTRKSRKITQVWPDIKIWVKTVQGCIKHKRINTRQIHTKMISPTEFSLGLEDILEFDIISNLPYSAWYQLIITLPLHIPNSKQESTNSGKIYHRRHDETCWSPNHDNNRQKVTIHRRSSTKNN